MNPNEYTNDSYLQLTLGPMFSGKTSDAIEKVNILSRLGNVLYINHILDNRISEVKDISTHNYSITRIPDTVKIIKLSNLSEIDDEIDLYDFIIIDESQFYPDLVEYVKKWNIEKRKNIRIYGLISDSNGNIFGDTLNLIPHADKIVFKRGFCSCCMKSKGVIRNSLYSKKISKDNDLIQIGGSNLYEGSCKDCFYS